MSGQAFAALPEDWGRGGSFPGLQYLWLDDNRNLTGKGGGAASLRYVAAGTHKLLPRLTHAAPTACTNAGPLPSSWGTASAFAQLAEL